MNNVLNQKILTAYRMRENGKVLIALMLIVVSIYIIPSVMDEDVAITISGVTLIVCFLYLLYAAIRLFSLLVFRRKTHKILKGYNELERALADLENAEVIREGGRVFAISKDFLFLPYGAILPMNSVAWIYMQRDTIRMLLIPLMRLHSCSLKLTNGMDVPVFYGKIKNKDAFDELIRRMMEINSSLLVGYSLENKLKYEMITTETHTVNE